MKKITCFAILICISYSCAQQKTEYTVRLIPEGYTGPVVIFFNQKNGESKEYEDGKRIYKIPRNGVLKTKFEPNYGIQNHQFFYVNEKGDRTEIPFIAIQQSDSVTKIEDKTKIYAFAEEAFSEGFGINANNLKYSTPSGISFYIGDLSDIESAYTEKGEFCFKHTSQQ